MIKNENEQNLKANCEIDKHRFVHVSVERCCPLVGVDSVALTLWINWLKLSI